MTIPSPLSKILVVLNRLTALPCSNQHEKWERERLLADEEDVNGAEIEVIEEREGGKPVVSWVLPSVELEKAVSNNSTARPGNQTDAP
jgi:hypothetical protein